MSFDFGDWLAYLRVSIEKKKIFYFLFHFKKKKLEVMPLIDLDRPLYIRRDRIYVDSFEKTVNSKDNYDIEFELSKRYQNVQSIEVTDYNLSPDMIPVFIAKTTSAPGNNLLDVRMVNLAGTEQLDFTVEFDPNVNYTDIDDLIQTTTINLLNTTMDAQGHPYFNTGNFTWQVNTTPVREVGPGIFYVAPRFDIGGALGNQAQGFFLFASGPSRGNTPARIFGFQEDLDTIVNVTGSVGFPYNNVSFTNAPNAYHNGALRPYRYIDVFIKESEPSFLRDVPTARVFTVDNAYMFSQETTPRPRLYTNPLLYADRLHIKLRYEDDRVPTERATMGWDLALDIITLSNEPNVPQWVIQRLTYP